MIKHTLGQALDAVMLIQSGHADARKLALRQLGKDAGPVTPNAGHLRLAIQWLKHAQDTSGDGGVSWGYRARRRHGSKGRVGWEAAYPETTGYIVETMLRYARLFDDEDCSNRALRMAEWEVGIQLPDGGFQGGRYGATPVASSTFVTGQVLFGLLYAHHLCAKQVSRQEVYLAAARRAGDWLLSCLDGEGRFVRGYSHFCAPGAKAYEARTGWALAILGRCTRESAYLDAATRMSSYAVQCRQPNGWFQDNDLEDNSQPLTHTIGYVLEGLLETGQVVDRRDFTDAVIDSLERIAKLVRSDGFLAGRWRSDWTPAVSWCCLTGSAQLASVCFRADHRFALPHLAEIGRRLLSFVSGTQLQAGFHPGLIGGIHGSYPFDGGYGQDCVLNWATKFYADAVMDYLQPASSSRRS